MTFRVKCKHNTDISSSVCFARYVTEPGPSRQRLSSRDLCERERTGLRAARAARQFLFGVRREEFGRESRMRVELEYVTVRQLVVS